jgi:hypothetical protein
MTESQSVSQSSFTATVRAADGVRFAASARTKQHLTEQIARYVRQRCDDVLWPAAARQVRELIESDKLAAAIALYFAQVGDRWDEEYLELEGLSLDASSVSTTDFAEVS